MTKDHFGFLNSITDGIFNSGYISGGQHVVPIASLIYFLNVKFFGLNFLPYAFMSLFLHAVNSFLIFLLIKILLFKKDDLTKNLYAVLGSLFFAISPVPMHAITGFAAFYGQNVLSVTFFIFCILCYKYAFIKKKKKFIYFSFIFIFLSLFTKESAFFLFLLLPIMTILEDRVFSYKFLSKIFLICLVIYFVIRFLIPNINSLPEKITDTFIPQSYKQERIENKIIDTGTVTSNDISIYKNLFSEIMFRTVTFPVKMVGTIFIPRETVFLIVQLLAPIISPTPPGGDFTIQSAFLYGSGNSVIIYLVSLVIIIFLLVSIFKFIHRKQYEEARPVVIGLAIIMLSALPLVAIIFTFPRWGYDIYFDSRHYYNSQVGAAILFPFLIFGVAKFISKSLHAKKIKLLFFLIFLLWLTNDIYAFRKNIQLFTRNYTVDRKEVVRQITGYLPRLKNKTVLYIETDGKGPFGSSLPFFTSVPQALTVIYFNSSPLPNSFFDKPLFSGNSQGYQYADDRGFGYYASKKDLADALVSNTFTTKDIYAFYYYSRKVKLKNITPDIRNEMDDYLTDRRQNANWIKFIDSKKTFILLHPLDTQIKNGENFIQISGSNFDYKLFFSTVS